VFSEVLGVKLKTPFMRIPHKEAIDKYGSDKPDLRKETKQEYCFLWVTDFPLLERDEEENRWKACHHPFTSPRQKDIPLLDGKDLSGIKARAYDLVLNGEEIGSGSIRIHSIPLQKKIFQVLGISEKEAEEKFGFLLRAFEYGAPPHGGVAFGLDRLYAIISGSESIREVIAFPKTQRGMCLMSGAPSGVESKQLKELNVKLIEQESEKNKG